MLLYNAITTIYIEGKIPFWVQHLKPGGFFSLTDKDLRVEEALSGTESDPLKSPFCLLMKQKEGIHLGPKNMLDIPISFSPEDMKKFQAECVLTVTKEDGGEWFVTPSMELR